MMSCSPINREILTMNSRDFKELIRRIKEETDIVEVIQERIHLDTYNRTRCPFHADRNPSFSVNESEQYFYCFGCGVGGDVIKFLQLYEEKSFMEVIRGLAFKAGISIPHNSFKR
jgi:DNA primase